MKFNSAEGMHHYLCNNGELYNPVKEVYMFQYNEDGAICYYCISEDHAAELAVKSIEDGEYWGAYLGTGGHIYEAEEALEICNDFADENWINCREYAADILLKEAKKRSGYKFSCVSVESTDTLDGLRRNWIPDLLENGDPIIGTAVLESGYLDIELNIHSVAQCTRDENKREDYTPVCSYFCCVKHGDKDTDWESFDYIDAPVNVDWKADDWKEQLEKDMVVTLYKYAFEKCLSFDHVN